MALTATTGFSINSVFWLRSLSDSEQGPTRRVLEDLEPFFAQIGVPFQLRDVKTPGELYAALQSLANSTVKRIVQLDMHGTKEGLVLVGSGEVAPWREVVPRLRAINVASGANLCVVAGVCFAFYAIRSRCRSVPLTELTRDSGTLRRPNIRRHEDAAPTRKAYGRHPIVCEALPT